MRVLWSQVWRFGVVGASNTLLTGVLLWILASVIDPRIAYTVVFALGIAYSALLTSRFVFSSRSSPQRLTAFVLWYLAVYAVGLVLVDALDDPGRSSLVLAAVTIAVTAPLSFVGGRLIFGRDVRDVDTT